MNIQNQANLYAWQAAKMQKAIYCSITRKCDKCAKYTLCNNSFFTERVWICEKCRIIDISTRVENMMRKALAKNSSSLKEFLEISIL